MDPSFMRWCGLEEVNKENQASGAAPKKDGGGSAGVEPAAAAKPKARRAKDPAKDPAKGVLRLPTPATLRKEARADEEAIANTDPKAAKKFGKERVKLVHQMVDADWHDGYDEQNEAIFDYFKAFEKFLRGVFDMAVMDGVAFERCHEVMKALADSWQNMKSIPARCGIEEAFEDVLEGDDECVRIELGEGKEPITFANPTDIFARFWPILLWAAASSSEIEDALLYRWMKDASEYDANLPRGDALWKLVAGEKEVKNEAGEVTSPAKEPTLRAKKSGMNLKNGVVRLIKLHANRSQWASLDSCKKSYKRKRVMDRRYDGPKNRRTRNFDDFDGGFGLFGGLW